MAAGLEVELKLRADDEGPLRILGEAKRLGPAILGPLHEVDELDRYLDTADGRLAAARWACRLRRRGESLRVSLKGPAQHGPREALHRRPELEGPAGSDLEPAGWPPSEARERLETLSGGQALLERFALGQRRGERPVRVGGDWIGTLSLDRVTVLRNEHPRGVFVAVELELRPGLDDPGLADELLEALLRIPGLAVEPRSKLQNALLLLGDPA